MDAAQKPLIVAGHGVIISQAYAELRELAEKTNIPVVTTLHGISSFPETHELNFGMVGMHGSAYAYCWKDSGSGQCCNWLRIGNLRNHTGVQRRSDSAGCCP